MSTPKPDRSPFSSGIWWSFTKELREERGTACEVCKRSDVHTRVRLLYHDPSRKPWQADSADIIIACDPCFNALAGQLQKLRRTIFHRLSPAEAGTLVTTIVQALSHLDPTDFVLALAELVAPQPTEEAAAPGSGPAPVQPLRFEFATPTPTPAPPTAQPAEALQEPTPEPEPLPDPPEPVPAVPEPAPPAPPAPPSPVPHIRVMPAMPPTSPVPAGPRSPADALRDLDAQIAAIASSSQDPIAAKTLHALQQRRGLMLQSLLTAPEAIAIPRPRPAAPPPAIRTPQFKSPADIDREITRLKLSIPSSSSPHYDPNTANAIIEQVRQLQELKAQA